MIMGAKQEKLGKYGKIEIKENLMIGRMTRIA